MTSKLEAALANDLHLMACKADAPWPEAVREMHPLWCCECPKVLHGVQPAHFVDPGPICHGCRSRSNGVRSVYWHAYDKPRDFRVDFCWVKERVICEVEGVRYGAQGGRHQTGVGFANDLTKYSLLELAGWRIVRVGRAQIADGTALALLGRALGLEAG